MVITEKPEPHLHARREVPERGVEEVADLGEVDDLVEPLRDLALAQPVQPGGEPDVVARRQVADEAAGDLDQRSDAAAHLDRALVGQQDAGDELEQGALALAVGADEADGLAPARR